LSVRVDLLVRFVRISTVPIKLGFAMYFDDFGPDENDKLFDELDQLVKFAEKRQKMGYSLDKIYVDSEIANLMFEEVPEEDVKIYEQIGGSCVAEIKYRGFNFISVSPVKTPKPS